jgi:hypothetical protein
VHSSPPLEGWGERDLEARPAPGGPGTGGRQWLRRGAVATIGARWRRKRPLPSLVALVSVLGLFAAACSSLSTGASPSASSSPPQRLPATTTTTVPPTTTTTTEQPGWNPVSTGPSGIAVDERTFSEPDGSQVTVARFRAGETRFALHVGSTDPPVGSAVIPADAGSAVSGSETPALLAAFNGGFQVSTGSGGFEVDGVTLVPLVNGMASFVIDTNGTGHVGVWGQGLPAPGEQVLSVRQNLPPLVSASQPSSQISDIAAWGATLGGGAMVARSGLGEDAQGNILYAGSMSALPSDIADALVAAGAVNAMELDINPEWVQLALATTPGGPLSTGVPGQNRPADQYLTGWTRDFVTVLSAG